MKTVIVTGATSGIGLAICDLLLKDNYNVIALGRSKEQIEKAKTKLLEQNKNKNIIFFCADLLKKENIIKVTKEIKDYLDKKCNKELYALINNAGCTRSKYMTNSMNIEHQFFVNYLSGFIIVQELMNYIKNNNSLILFTSSTSHKKMFVNWKNPMFKGLYNSLLAYKQSKLCNMLLVYKLRELNIKSYGIDPGLVNTNIGNKNTKGLVNFIWHLRKKSGVDSIIPAQTYLMICNNPNLNGLYYYLDKEIPYSKYINKKNSDKLFKLSQKLLEK